MKLYLKFKNVISNEIKLRIRWEVGFLDEIRKVKSLFYCLNLKYVFFNFYLRFFELLVGRLFLLLLCFKDN